MQVAENCVYVALFHKVADLQGRDHGNHINVHLKHILRKLVMLTDELSVLKRCIERKNHIGEGKRSEKYNRRIHAWHRYLARQR